MYNFIGQIPSEGFQLITDSQDAQAIKEHYFQNAPKGWRIVCDSFFVEILDGEYGRIYGFIGIVPDEDKELIRIN